jgi:hypothetical protein
MTRLFAFALAAAVFSSPLTARADDDTEAPAQMPYATPRETLIPGAPGMAGGFHFMLNAFAHLQNVGLGGHTIQNATVKPWNGGETVPLLQDDWLMGYGRDANGYVEGLVMLNLEPLTIGPEGVPELGQSGEGLWDAQHAHQFLHQAMIAFHPLAGVTGPNGALDLALFAGQGSATIGPPIFMHRASSPGPTVPRKHHKGENPHETSPVLGTQLRVGSTWLEASAFGDEELTPHDSRFYPHPAPIRSAAARVRQGIGDLLELQVSGERLRDQGHGEPDAWQASASAYAWGDVHRFRLDALLDYGVDIPDMGPSASALLFEVAARSPRRRDTLWLRSESLQREESDALGGGVSGLWFFESMGFERVAWSDPTSGLQVGIFGEATYARIPGSLASYYGREDAVTMSLGLHLFGMWMLDGSLRPMSHHHHH